MYLYSIIFIYFQTHIKSGIMNTYEKRMKLAKELKIARIRQDLTQTELSRILKKASSFVNKYETGERKLEVVEFFIICDVLKTNPYQIMNLIKDTNDEK